MASGYNADRRGESAPNDVSRQPMEGRCTYRFVYSVRVRGY